MWNIYRQFLEYSGYNLSPCVRQQNIFAFSYSRGVTCVYRWATNYVSDWWEEYVYLRGRSPLVVNSNFYGIDAILINPVRTQAARAATVISICLQFRRLIERQELEPVC